MNAFRHRLLVAALLLAGWAASSTCLADLKGGLAQFDRGDYAGAVASLKPLAEHGDVSAQYAMGLANYNQTGAARNVSEAMRWFRLAAAQGLPHAEFCLGVMYAHGDGVAADNAAAVAWFHRAAAKGHGPAFFNLGIHYAQGIGVGADMTTALADLMVATDLGVPEAADKQEELSEFLGRGRTASARAIARRLEAGIRRVALPPLPAIDKATPKPPVSIRN